MATTNTVKLAWDAVTKDLAGKPITGALYNVYRDGAKVTPAPLSVFQYQEDLIDQAATVFYQVGAIYKGMEGPLSPALSVDPVQIPEAPRVTITVTVTVN